MAIGGARQQPRQPVPGAEVARHDTITLVGQSRSGKTNILAALLYNPNALQDLQTGSARVANPAISTLANSGSAEEKELSSLSVHQRNILRGQDAGNEGTDKVRIYPARLEFDDPLAPPPKAGLFGMGTDKPAGRTQLPFSIVDGRGADIASSVYIDPNDNDIENQEIFSRVNEYRFGLDISRGMVVCMPILAEEFASDVADQLVREITSAIRRKAAAGDDLPQLRNIALVFTKYDALFAHEGASAGRFAHDPAEAIRLLRGQAIVRRFAPILHDATRRDGYRTLVFPASTFGFVGGDGASNFYNFEPAPGLLSRAIADEDYRNPDLNPPGRSGLRDHFPLQIAEKDALTLWQPFNIAPPVLYALTGRVTGPLALHPEDLL